MEEASTSSQPQILIGQVQSLLANGDVSLLWYKNISANLNISYGEILAINCGLLRAVAYRSERYFKNKCFWITFAQFIALICMKLVQDRSVMCFLLDIAA